MIALADLLAGHAERGVLRCRTSLDAAYVGGAVRRAGGTFAHLDSAAGTDLAAFHRAVAAVLDFPDYYGSNLDALNDCLGDLAARTSGVPILWWDDWQHLAGADAGAFERVTGLLGEWLCLVLPGAQG